MSSRFEAERRQILEMLESGSISVEEAIALVNALGENDHTPVSGAEIDTEAATSEDPPRPGPGPARSRRRLPRSWFVAFWTGAALLAGGVWMLIQAIRQPPPGFWFYFSLAPIILGALSLTAAWMARRARWLHLRIHAADGSGRERLAWSIPLPLGLSAWMIMRMPLAVDSSVRSALNDVLTTLQDDLTTDQDISVEVSGPGNGEQFEFFLG